MEPDSSIDSTISAKSASAGSAHLWRPLNRDQRRVLGVLIEKSKTTPDVYPMSINGIKTGCNQKSNRSPLLDLEEHRVEDVLYELRQLGCVIEVHSGGRVPKFKHQAYEWLSVSKPELSVLTELLLRGEQTVGDLRARASRMEKSIETLDDLRPILASLKDKGLLVELSPAGRGQTVTHNLYQHNELDRLKQQFASGAIDDLDDEPEGLGQRTSDRSSVGTGSNRNAAVDNAELTERVNQLEQLVANLQEQLSELKRTIES